MYMTNQQDAILRIEILQFGWYLCNKNTSWQYCCRLDHYHFLTHLHLYKMDAFCRRYFQKYFREWKVFYFDEIVTEVYNESSSWWPFCCQDVGWMCGGRYLLFNGRHLLSSGLNLISSSRNLLVAASYYLVTSTYYLLAPIYYLTAAGCIWHLPDVKLRPPQYIQSWKECILPYRIIIMKWEVWAWSNWFGRDNEPLP